jgi:hypothetical protein
MGASEGKTMVVFNSNTLLNQPRPPLNVEAATGKFHKHDYSIV